MKHTILLLSPDPVIQKQGFLIIETLYPPKKTRGGTYSTIPFDIKTIEVIHDKLWRFTGTNDVAIECLLYKAPFNYPSRVFDAKPTEKKALREASVFCQSFNRRAGQGDESVKEAIENHLQLTDSSDWRIAVEHVHTVLDTIDEYLSRHRHVVIKSPGV